MCSSDEGEQGAAHGQQDQAAVQVEHGGRRSADAQTQLRNTHKKKHVLLANPQIVNSNLTLGLMDFPITRYEAGERMCGS